VNGLAGPDVKKMNSEKNTRSATWVTTGQRVDTASARHSSATTAAAYTT
jgi:hypothetical protein